MSVVPPSRFTVRAPARLREQAYRLFDQHGIQVSLSEIAYAANTRTDTAVKNFGDINGLLEPYLLLQIQAARACWKTAGLNEVGGEQPETVQFYAETVLRRWIPLVEQECLIPLSAHCQLSRISAQMSSDHPMWKHIEYFREHERETVHLLCGLAPFAEPEDLASCLLLLVEGARNERQLLGYSGPARKLTRVAHSLMDLHRLKDEILEG